MPITGTLIMMGGLPPDDLPYRKEGAPAALLIRVDPSMASQVDLLPAPYSVEVWPAHPDGVAPSDCTPETFAHLQVRLAATEDNLAREVRSNQVAALVRAHLESMYEPITAQYREQRDEVQRLRALLHSHGLSADTPDMPETLDAINESLVADLAYMTASRDKYERKMNEWAEAHSDLKVAHKSVVADNDRLLDMVNDRDAKMLALSLDNDRLAAELAEAFSDANELRRRIAWMSEGCDGNHEAEADLVDDTERSLAEISEALDEG